MSTDGADWAIAASAIAVTMDVNGFSLLVAHYGSAMVLSFRMSTDLEGGPLSVFTGVYSKVTGLFGTVCPCGHNIDGRAVRADARFPLGV